MDITVRIIGYKLVKDGKFLSPLNESVAAELLSAPKGVQLPFIMDIQLGCASGDGNRLIRDLYMGSSEYGVENCPIGSIVKFKDCVFKPPHFIEAFSYEVVTTKPAFDRDLNTNPNYVDLEPGYIRPLLSPSSLECAIKATQESLDDHALATVSSLRM